MRSRLRMTLLLLLGALGSGLLFLALEFGRTEGRTRIFDVDSEHYDREQQQQHRQHDVLPGDFKSADRGPSSWPAWTRTPKIWNSKQNGEIKTYPNIAQCQILHQRNSSSSSSVNITDISLLLDPKRFSRFRNVFDARCLSLHRALLAHLRTQQSKELLKSFVCGSNGSWKTSVFFKVFEEDIEDAKRVLREWAPEVRWSEEGVCEKGVMGTGEWVRGGVWKRDGQQSQKSKEVLEDSSSVQSPPPYVGSSTPDPGQDVASAIETRSEDHVARAPRKNPERRCIAYDIGDEVSGHTDYYIDIQLTPVSENVNGVCQGPQS